MKPGFLWTCTKNKWNAHNAIWSLAIGPSITRNLITRVLTIYHVKLAQSTAFEQQRFDLHLILWNIALLTSVVLKKLIVCFTGRYTLFFQYVCFLLPIFLPCVSSGTYCNEDKCCVVPHLVADIRVAWLVDVCTHCVPIAALHQNKRSIWATPK